MKSEKLLSPSAIFLLGINSIIGSGIFLLSGQIYKQAGSASLLAILLAGISITIIAFSYGNMSKIYPENGGAFLYAKNSFGQFAGFIVGMLTWLLGVVTLATEVSALLTALKMILPHINVHMIGLSILLVLGIISYFGASILGKLDNLTSFVKLLIIAIFIISCIFLVKFSHFTFPSNLTTHTAFSTGLLSAYGTTFFFFTGFSFLPVNAQKMQNPAKNLPKMMMFVMISVITIYFLIQAITIGVLENSLPNSVVPAATAFSKIVGPIGIPLIVIAICISIFGVIVAATFNTPTILASLAEAHENIPARFAKNNPFGSPTLSITLTTVCAIALFMSGNYVFLAGLTVFMSFVQYFSTGLANIKAKFRFIGFGTVIFSLVLLSSFTISVLIFGFAIIIVLAIFYLIVKKSA